MGRFLIALAGVAVLTAAMPQATGTPAEPPFAATVRDLTFTDKEGSLTVLPGEDVALELSGPNGPYRVVSESGSVSRRTTTKWQWRAPATAGLGTLKVEDVRGHTALTLQVFVLVPFSEIKDGRLNGYQIGSYPAATRPPGFVEVTAGNVRTKLSRHFELRQFLCKQPAGYPKYVVLSGALILKLERIIEALGREGRKVDSLTVMSGYRTPYYNEGIGNVRDSQHTAGTAADIFIDQHGDGRMDDLDGDGVITRDDAVWLFTLIDRLDRLPGAPFRGGLGDYDATAAHGPFVHVDVRGRLARWRG